MKKIEQLHYYAEKPLKSTILVICNKYGKVAKSTKLYKAVALHGVILDTKKLYDNQVPDWIIATLKAKGYTIDAAAAALLTEFLGNDLGRIIHELEKLMIVLPPETKIINAQHIEKNIGISKEYNNFELSKALGQRNVLKANKIIDYFAKNPKASPMPVTIPVLFNFFSKLLLYHYLPDKSRTTVASELGLHPFFVNEYEFAAKKFTPIKAVSIIGLLREYDVKSKGVGSANVPDGELLRELVYKILH
jgi:DNA polymerase III subunit delta